MQHGGIKKHYSSENKIASFRALLNCNPFQISLDSGSFSVTLHTHTHTHIHTHSLRNLSAVKGQGQLFNSLFTDKRSHWPLLQLVPWQRSAMHRTEGKMKTCILFSGLFFWRIVCCLHFPFFPITESFFHSFI